MRVLPPAIEGALVNRVSIDNESASCKQEPMAAESAHQDSAVRARDLERSVALGRRRLLRGGLGAAPILATLASGPVSAGLCTTGSAFASLNASGTQTSQTCGGRSPATWMASGGSGGWPINGNTLFSACFSPAMSDSTLKIKTVLDPSKGYDPVACNCVAALLNASASPPLTPASILGAAYVKAIWSSYKNKGYFEPTAGIQWKAGDIVDWITTTYS